MDRPVIQLLHGGRLHLSHGPIDVVLRAWGAQDAVHAAYVTAAERFPDILPTLVGELGELRRPIADGPQVIGPVACRMVAATAPFAPVFVTPMAAVAGAVADEIMAAMLAAAPLERAYVNDGGDIAIHLAPGQRMTVGLAGDGSRDPGDRDGDVTIAGEDGIGGVATSGRGGRSFSLGIADAVTVLARTAAAADAAATLIANAVDLDSSAVRRTPAVMLDPDSDLGARLVTVDVGPLAATEIEAALAAGTRVAEDFRRRGLIHAAALALRDGRVIVGQAGFRALEVA